MKLAYFRAGACACVPHSMPRESNRDRRAGAGAGGADFDKRLAVTHPHAPPPNMHIYSLFDINNRVVVYFVSLSLSLSLSPLHTRPLSKDLPFCILMVTFMTCLDKNKMNLGEYRIGN